MYSFTIDGMIITPHFSINNLNTFKTYIIIFIITI
jgi:hypothetical protein